MSTRSLTASEIGIKQAKQALERRGLNQKMFAEEIQFAYSTINNFFNQKPIYRTKFEEICIFLGLDWREIAGIISSDEQVIRPKLEAEIEQPQTPEAIWQQLKNKGSHTEKMGLVIAKEDTLAWGWGNQKRYEKSVRVGTYVRFEINIGTPGFLLLLQKDTSAQFWCFCPSYLAPKPKLETGTTSLPQAETGITAFPIEGIAGKEEIIAAILPDFPHLQWLPSSESEPLELTDNHLAEILNIIGIYEGTQLLYTEYQILS